MTKQIEVLLLDMGNTFMFGCDRFSVADDMGSTYHALGGERLTDGQIQLVFDETLRRMEEMYRDPAHFEAFPPVRDVLSTCEFMRDFDESEWDLLDEVFAQHEVGIIAPEYAAIINQLATRFRLGVVSNVWAPSTLFYQAFKTAGVLELFEVVVFSSDHGSIKPSPRIFRIALDAMRTRAHRAAFVGDDLRCDVGGALGVGLTAVWLDAEAAGVGPSDPVPDFTIRDLVDLVPGGVFPSDSRPTIHFCEVP